MLATPGHSPRHLLSTPSSSSDHGTSGSSRNLALPPPKRHKRSPQTVLDEDAYVAAIEKIIERDFFPDIPKLQNRLEWLEAVRSGDPVVIRDAQLNIIQRRRDRAELNGTPASVADSFATPNSLVGGSPSSSLQTPLYSSSVQQGALSDPDVNPVDTSLSLDDFLKRYTSEDNASFSKILDKLNKKREEKYKFLSDKEAASSPSMISDREHISTDGYGTSSQTVSTLEGWGYKAKNLLMYDSAEREEAPLTVVEKEERLKNLGKEINIRNTRFHGKMFDSKLREDETRSTLYPPLAGSTPSSWPLSDPESLKKKYDLEDLRKTPQAFVEKDTVKNLGRSGTSGYGYVATPSPAPGVDESPFMTWGEIEGTPLRLETEDTPVGIGGSGDGPHFKIPAPPSRDTRAHSLSRDAARSLREKSRFYQVGSSPSPARGSSSPALKSLSAAAQNFVRKAMAKSCTSVDAKLRASYRASTTPGTPRMARNAVRFREGSVTSREGSAPLQSPLLREGSASLQSPLLREGSAPLRSP